MNRTKSDTQCGLNKFKFKGYRLCRRPLQRLMIAGLKQLMKLILGELVGAGGRVDQAKMH